MLVDYSDSETDPQQAPRAKRRKLHASRTPKHSSPPPPPPPAAFHSLYATNVRTSIADDPGLHAGRTRQVAHTEGSWPTHVYLEWTPDDDESHSLDLMISECRKTVADGGNQVHSFLQSGLNVRQPLHISLSAPLILKTEIKDDFADDVQKEIIQCGGKTFTIRPTHLEWVSNFGHTRSFLVLRLCRPENDDMNKLLRASNACARKKDLPLLYVPTASEDKVKQAGTTGWPMDLSLAFHISIAWSLEKMTDLQQPLRSAGLEDALSRMKVKFDVIKLKIGNVVHDIPLSA